VVSVLSQPLARESGRASKVDALLVLFTSTSVFDGEPEINFLTVKAKFQDSTLTRAIENQTLFFFKQKPLRPTFRF